MSDREKTVPDLCGIDPKKPFFMALSVGRDDGSLDDLTGEGVEMVGTEAGCIESLKIMNLQYPTLEGWVYRCTPVARVWRGKTRVTKLSGK